MSANKLNTNYNLYFHDPYSYDWNLSSYEKLTDIKSIEDYSQIELLTREIIHLGMFFTMRENVSPLWNETNNNYSFSIKILKNDAMWYWNYFNSLLLGENLLKDKYVKKWDILNGISISPKKNFCIIKIWASELLEENIRNIIKIPNKYTGDIIIKHYN